MATKSVISIGCANKLCLAAVDAGHTADTLNWLSEDKTGILAMLLEVKEGRAEIKMIERPTVASVPVTITFGLSLSAERQTELLGDFQRLDKDQLPNPRASGTVDWKPWMLELYLAECQTRRGGTAGRKVRDAIRDSGKELYSIGDLAQMKEKGLLPNAAKGTCIFAWGDILRRGSELYVRCLCRGDGGWHWYCGCFDGGWPSCRPAAVRARS